MAKGNKPDFVVMTSRDSTDRNSGLVQVGAAWHARSLQNGNQYISIKLNAKPWGDWDGTLQLYPSNRQPGEDDIPV